MAASVPGKGHVYVVFANSGTFESPVWEVEGIFTTETLANGFLKKLIDTDYGGSAYKVSRVPLDTEYLRLHGSDDEEDSF